VCRRCTFYYLLSRICLTLVKVAIVLSCHWHRNPRVPCPWRSRSVRGWRVCSCWCVWSGRARGECRRTSVTQPPSRSPHQVSGTQWSTINIITLYIGKGNQHWKLWSTSLHCTLEREINIESCGQHLTLERDINIESCGQHLTLERDINIESCGQHLTLERDINIESCGQQSTSLHWKEKSTLKVVVNNQPTGDSKVDSKTI